MTEAAELEDILFALTASGSREADLILMEVAPEFAPLLELCAIPHMFDAEIAGVLKPDADAGFIEAFIEEVTTLSAVTQQKGCYVLHDIVREQLFGRWLQAERREGFAAASQALVEHYQRRAPLSDDAEPFASVVAFHRVGADPEAGFAEFRDLYRRYRETCRYTAAHALARLVSEYEPLLSPADNAWLLRFEADAAIDARNWQRAVSILQDLEGRQLPNDLAVSVRLALARALRQLERLDEAEEHAVAALRIASGSADGVEQQHVAYQELGLIARDRGDLESAEQRLRTAVKLADRWNDLRAQANAYNSLGTALQRTEPRQAIKMFLASVERLKGAGEDPRRAQVLNNLGRAYADLGDWKRSLACYEESLDLKRRAGDLHGEAVTQLNLARVRQARNELEAARAALEQSVALFRAVNDHGHAERAERELGRFLAAHGAAVTA
jgi:tetratricopeptide (TPR) repeat protein